MPRLSFIRARRRPGARPTNLVEITGVIERVMSPKKGEPFKGWAIVRVAGKVVVGCIPFLDNYFIYRLRCAYSVHKQYGAQYEIVEFGQPAFEPVPISCITLCDMLVQRYKWSDWDALQAVRAAQDDLFAKTLHDTLDLGAVARAKHVPWVKMLCEDMLVFAYVHLVDLPTLWSERLLSRFTAERLFEIARKIGEDPIVFCFSWRNDFHLPRVPATALQRLETAARRPLDQMERNLVHAYSHLRAWLANRNQLCFDTDALPAYMRDNASVAYAIRNQLFKPKYERTEDGGVRRYYLLDTYQQLCVLSDRMREILESHDEPELVAKQPNTNRLNDAQLGAYESVLPQNLLVILGDAGTGKTLVGSLISRRFKSNVVLPLACYGRMAANMRSKYGRGMTVAKALSNIRSGNRVGRTLVEQTQVVIIDEISTLTLDMLVPLISQLRNLSRLILMGDEKQTPPVDSGGDLVAALIRRYEGTPVLHRLTQIERIERGRGEYDGLLLECVNRIKHRQIDIDYYWGLDTEHPFVVLQRARVPPHATHEQRLAAVTKDMKKVLKYHSIDEIQVITQKNETRALLNQALYNLTKRASSGYREGVFTVGEKILFTENYYPDGNDFPQLRSSEVMNGDVYEITAIHDVESCDPDQNEPRQLSLQNTAEKKQYSDWDRIITLRGGKRINLKHYPIANIAKGYAVTIYMFQGSEGPVIVVYIHEGVSSTFNWREFYTAVTRAQRRVIIFTGWGESGDLEGTDIHRILNTDCPSGESFVHNWLPAVSPFGVLLDA